MIGQTVSHYKIIEEIGHGGMGVVYKAEDTKLKRTVALKFLPPELTRDIQAKERFIHEAQAASALEHTNICNVHEIDETDQGQMFIVMACYQGMSLKERLLEMDGGARDALPVQIEEAISITTQIARGLEQAHNKGIIHRDIKPANLFITDQGEVKILDFGLAKLSGHTVLTKEGSTLGTVAYMSPEQSEGQVVDQQTDIWSLGVVLYEMLGGQRPFRADYDQAVVYSILNEQPQSLQELNPQIPPELQKIVDKCLVKDPGQRYQTMGELLEDLQPLQQISQSVSGTRPVSSKRMDGRKKMLAYTMAGLVGILIAAVLIRYILLPAEWMTGQPERKMLVVLPFENLGSADDVYFADGMTDEIISRLGRIRGIGVISRHSAIHYAGIQWSTQQIAEDLNVQYIVNGTVRWAYAADEGERVRITPRLIRVADDIELWSESYDRQIDDIFDIQSEIASKVVAQLGITLNQSEQVTVEQAPTTNLQAYQAYLQGRHASRSPHFTFENWLHVIDCYQRAVDLDSTFAVAWARLASAHARLHFLRHDLSQERLDKAARAAKRAETLAADNPEVLLSLGYYYLRALRDHQQALNKWQQAKKSLPDDSRISEAVAFLYQTEGRWDEAITALETAFRFNPHDAELPSHLGLCYWWNRHYQKAIEALNQAIALAPNENWPYLYKVFTLWSMKGATEESRHTLQAVHPDHYWHPWAWYWQDVGERDFRRALQRLAANPKDWVRNKMWTYPKPLLQAMIYTHTGEVDSAAVLYRRSKTMLQSEIQKWPQDPRYHAALGLTYAALGQRQEALREGNKALEILPLSKDAAYGLPFEEMMIWIYIFLDEKEKAIDQIEHMLQLPSWITVNYLNLHPLSERLADHPRYQALLEKYKLN